MNEALRLISKALTPFGYHVRPYRGLNLLRVPALEVPANDGNITAPRKAFADPVIQPPEGDLSKLVIFFRTCIRDNRNINPRPRVSGAPLEEDTLRCLWSLICSVNAARQSDPELTCSIIVLDDNSSAGPLDRIRALLTRAEVPAQIRATTTTGQGASLHEQFAAGKTHDALVYFCEDDYLHEPDAISCLWRFYQRIAKATGAHLVLYPQEHNVLYSNHYPSYILRGEDRHWRTMRHATHTLLTHGRIVAKYWDYFENTKFVGNRKKRRKGSEDRTTNKLFRHVPGFSPLKPCAVHFQYEDLLPPFYNWQLLWDANRLPDQAP
jgi:hypothetical protein